ncbi:MAG: TIGR02186 family protein [Pseudomonadota bacterium]|nr:TIGR02186 family protein [Pseudomonadota bacterium]
MTRLQSVIAGIWLAVIALVTTTVASAAPTRLVADLSQSHVDITSGYHGTELLLFGAYEGVPGDELVLIVEGPANDIIQRRKEKRAGVWVNVETLLWKQAPSFYHLFSTAELDEIADPQSRLKADIGPLAGGLKLVAGADGGGNGHGGSTPEADMSDAEAKLGTADQKAGLRRNMVSNGLWLTSPASIVTQQDMLFRTMLTLPSNVPTGDYSVRILHFRDGVALSERVTDMNIRKAGMSALIYSFAHEYPVFYGLFAIAFAVASGWLAAVAFRRG